MSVDAQKDISFRNMKVKKDVLILTNANEVGTSATNLTSLQMGVLILLEVTLASATTWPMAINVIIVLRASVLIISFIIPCAQQSCWPIGLSPYFRPF